MRYGQRSVKIGRLDDDQAGKVFLAVDERAVGQQRLALTLAQRGCRLVSVQTNPAGDVRPRENRGGGVVDRRRRVAQRIRAAIGQQCVLHQSSSNGSRAASSIRRTDELRTDTSSPNFCGAGVCPASACSSKLSTRPEEAARSEGAELMTNV